MLLRRRLLGGRLDRLAHVGGQPTASDCFRLLPIASDSVRALLRWEGSWACIELLRTEPSWLAHALGGRKVVELGSGIGLLGLCAAAAGAHVLVTDVPAVVVTTLEANVQANGAGAVGAEALSSGVAWRDAVAVGGGSIASQALNWLSPLSEQHYPNDPREAEIILAAECVWLRDLVEPFVQTVAGLLASPAPTASARPRFCLLAFRDRATDTSETFSNSDEVLRAFAAVGCAARRLGAGDAPESAGLVTTFFQIHHGASAAPLVTAVAPPAATGAPQPVSAAHAVLPRAPPPSSASPPAAAGAPEAEAAVVAQPAPPTSRVSVRISPAGGPSGGVRLALYVCATHRQGRRQRKAEAAVAAAVSSATIAFDLGSYGDVMNGAEVGALAKQLAHCYGYNRQLPTPFRLAVCGLACEAMPPVAAALAVHQWDRWVMERSDAPPWAAYAPPSLVYLSADAEHVLERLEPTDVLVIGGLVDHANVAARVGAALRVAEAHGVRTARLPLDEYVSVRKTSLTCLAVYQILAGFAACGDWATAVRDAPAMHCAPLRKYIRWKVASGLPPLGRRALASAGSPVPNDEDDELELEEEVNERRLVGNTETYLC